MALSNAQLAQQVNSLIAGWTQRERQYRDWLGGAASGGPQSDGRYPLTDGYGVTALVDCPAKLASTVSGPRADAEAAKLAAQAAQGVAAGHASVADQQRVLAQAALAAALAARDLSIQYRDRAANAEANALVYKTAAQAAASGLQAALDDLAAATTATEAILGDVQAAKAVALQAAVDAAASAASINPADYAAASHGHAISAITGLQTALNSKQAAGDYVLTSGFTWSALSGKPATFAPSAHSHVIADVTGLQTALDGKQASGSYVTTAGFTWSALAGKPTTFAPSAHTHVIADVTGLQTALDGKQATGAYLIAADLTWAAVAGKPATFTPSAHTHVIADVTGLQTVLDGKQAAGAYLIAADLTWAAVTGKPTTYAPSAHTHVIADVTGLQTALDGKQAAGAYLVAADLTWAALSGKPATFAPSAHSHVIADVSGLQAALDAKQDAGGGGGTAVAWAGITGKPSTFAPSAHSHVISDVTGLQTALDGKQASGSYVTTAGFTWASLSGKPSTFAPSAHSHVIADVTGLQTALDGKLGLTGGTLTSTLFLTGTSSPAAIFTSSGATANNRSARIYNASNGLLYFDLSNDAFSAASAWLAVTRSANTATSIDFYGSALKLNGNSLLTSVNNANWSGAVLSVANGGTGSATAAAALTALGGLPEARSKMRAYRSAALSLPAGSTTAVVMDVENFDDNNDHSTSTGRFTAPVAGVYLILGTVSTQTLPVGVHTLQVRVNGNIKSQTFHFQDTATWASLTANTMLKLSAGDYVQLHFENTSGTAISVLANEAYTHMEIIRV